MVQVLRVGVERSGLSDFGDLVVKPWMKRRYDERMKQEEEEKRRLEEERMLRIAKAQQVRDAAANMTHAERQRFLAAQDPEVMRYVHPGAGFETAAERLARDRQALESTVVSGAQERYGAGVGGPEGHAFRSSVDYATLTGKNPSADLTEHMSAQETYGLDEETLRRRQMVIDGLLLDANEAQESADRRRGQDLDHDASVYSTDQATQRYRERTGAMYPPGSDGEEANPYADKGAEAQKQALAASLKRLTQLQSQRAGLVEREGWFGRTKTEGVLPKEYGDADPAVVAAALDAQIEQEMRTVQALSAALRMDVTKLLGDDLPQEGASELDKIIDDVLKGM